MKELTKDTKPFSVFKKELSSTMLSIHSNGNFSLVSNRGDLIAVITPSVSIRANNFLLLAEHDKTLGFYNVFLAEDQPAIFKDAAKRAEFMDLLRAKLASQMVIHLTHSKAVTWDRVGNAITVRLGGSDIISFEPLDKKPELTTDEVYVIQYRSCHYAVKSRFAAGLSAIHFIDFAYSLVGNAFALLNSEK